jgi:energy-coupling factor transporter ATP-binding protein EcfA2
LGTTDREEAQSLVDQMSQLLGDQSYWNPTEQHRAQQNFDRKIVAAFYDDLATEERDSWVIRNDVIPLPGKDDGYAKVLFVGTTGAGKTTLVRQLIGTDPMTERFPSISAAKTTISDLEIVLTEDETYKTIVSFFDKNYVRRHIEECVLAALISHIDTGNKEEVEGKLLVHSEQRFRLSYLLGTSKTLVSQSQEEMTDEEGEPEGILEGTDDLITDEDKADLLSALTGYLSRIESLAESSKDIYQRLAEDLGILLDSATREDSDALQDIFEEEIYKNEDFQSLVDDILDDVESRFLYLEEGELVKDKSGWPLYWKYSLADRGGFIKRINRFSSNYAPHFGRLLTPLVVSMRVAGPFLPKWCEGSSPRLVLMDGEGLGHTPDSAASVSTRVTRRFQDSDSIILVDNAAQPMQAAPTAVLEKLVSSGHHSKLIVCFTHFDEVKGLNLPNIAMRKEHVLNSFDNSANSVGRTLGLRAQKVLRNCKSDRVFFLSNIQNPVRVEGKSLSYNELTRLVQVIEDSIKPPAPTEAFPVYDDSSLVLNIQKAAQEFHVPWEAKLKLRSDPRITPEHWTRIKALTRRLGELNIDEYDTLRPVADLITRLQVHLYLFIENPIRWNPINAPEAMKQWAIDSITREIDTCLHQFVSDRLFKEKVKDWYQAYGHRGIGSTTVRSHEIKDIYNQAAPIPGEVPTSYSSKFLLEIRKLVRKAVETAGGRFQVDLSD